VGPRRLMRGDDRKAAVVAASGWENREPSRAPFDATSTSPPFPTAPFFRSRRLGFVISGLEEANFCCCCRCCCSCCSYCEGSTPSIHTAIAFACGPPDKKICERRAQSHTVAGSGQGQIARVKRRIAEIVGKVLSQDRMVIQLPSKTKRIAFWGWEEQGLRHALRWERREARMWGRSKGKGPRGR